MDAVDPYADARLYDVIVGDVSTGAAFYRSVSDAHPGPILELGCGTGRLTVPLLDSGHKVTGLDQSEAMLKRARAKSQEVQWVRGNMTSFDLEERFSLIFVAFNTMLHLHTRKEFEALFDCVRRHLAPEGVFAFDVFNPSPSILARDPKQRHPVETVLDPAKQTALTVSEVTRYDRKSQTSRTLWYLSYPQRRDAQVLDLDLRILFPEELLTLLHYNGLNVLDRFGDYERIPFESESPQQVLICQPDPNRALSDL